MKPKCDLTVKELNEFFKSIDNFNMNMVDYWDVNTNQLVKPTLGALVVSVDLCYEGGNFGANVRIRRAN